MLERGVVAGDAVELLGALVRGNGDERATGAGGVVRELAGQAAQAREAGTADALGEGREEEDRVCVATHDLRDCERVLPADRCRFTEAAAPRPPRPPATPPARSSNAPLRVQIWLSQEYTSLGLAQKSGDRQARAPDVLAKCRGGRRAFAAAAAAIWTRSAVPMVVLSSAGRKASQRPGTNAPGTSRARQLGSHRRALQSCSEPLSKISKPRGAASRRELQPTGDCDDEMMPSALLSFR